MFRPQHRDTPTGARCFHHELVFLQHTHHCFEHAGHSGGDYQKAAALWRLRLPHGELSGDFSHRKHHAEHGGSQHRSVDSGRLPAQLLHQNALQGRTDHGVLLLAALLYLLPDGATLLLGRLQRRLRVLHLAAERGRQRQD